MNVSNKARPPVVEVVKSRYQPSKAEIEEEFTLPDVSPEEVARAILQPSELRYVSRPPREKPK